MKNREISLQEAIEDLKEMLKIMKAADTYVKYVGKDKQKYANVHNLVPHAGQIEELEAQIETAEENLDHYRRGHHNDWSDTF